MLRFTKLRLSGFKSFVEPAELLIEPGLTGVVGPNGCGKSNLVEALRWVMGETSANRLRGGEMDDVIFGGTAARPPRNIAEVVVEVDNGERSAPPLFGDAETLEICRRIERARGSVYRVNGREVRARDVQLLFADAASGARSAALVNQGHVTALISAKPMERRALLEEAAGIGGLHARRHEAELRLRGAEANLERLQDVLIALEGQWQGLKKQARQAARYRTLSERIRKAEAALLGACWREARGAAAAAAQRRKDATASVSELTGRAAERAAERAEAAAALPDLRRAETEVTAERQRLILARDHLEAEERRAETDRHAGQRRLEQMTADLARERALAADAISATAGLAAERERVEASRRGEEEARARAEAALAEVKAEVADLDARVLALTERVAANEARRAALKRALNEFASLGQRLSARSAELAAQERALSERAGGVADAEAVEAEAAGALAALDAARSELEAADAHRVDTTETTAAADRAQRAADGELRRLEAEEKALARLTAVAPDRGSPIVDSVAVERGLETALAAALGEDLSASEDTAALVRWRALPPLAEEPPLPEGARPLAAFVAAPAALDRRLAQVGLVDADADGQRLQERLCPGQRLVTREGALWRWDGYTVATGSITAAAVRLEHRNRLKEIRDQLTTARAEAAAAAERTTAARRAAESAAEAERAARAACRALDGAYQKARDALADARHQRSKIEARRTVLAASLADVDAQRADTARRAEAAVREWTALPDVAADREALNTLRAELTELRNRQLTRQSALEALAREAAGRTRRLAAIAVEVDSWRARAETAERQIAALQSRAADAEAECARLRALPAEIAARREALFNALEDVERRRKDAADRVAAAENRLASADLGTRAAENALADAREERIRAESAVEKAEQACRDLRRRIAERLEIAPERLADVAEPEATLGAAEWEVEERQLERLKREREQMGPVNLRAEQEASELRAQMDTLVSQSRDLTEAIAKLRRGIAELDRESRERVLASFSDVDRHFRELFLRLFGGGRARLTLTESEDPLAAGLEIVASPPGKRPQVLSLLSGGEQALTAIALRFAVFLTNPAPICVLDEVDATLDDANVDRFCQLLSEMAKAGTRFLVITHHRMTMARMDRLFGVTMAERGVSHLVSVDLQRAERLRQTA